jgi:hypothetical protein
MSPAQGVGFAYAIPERKRQHQQQSRHGGGTPGPLVLVALSPYFGASLDFEGSPCGPCFVVGGALGEPLGSFFDGLVRLIPVVALLSFTAPPVVP